MVRRHNFVVYSGTSRVILPNLPRTKLHQSLKGRIREDVLETFETVTIEERSVPLTPSCLNRNDAFIDERMNFNVGSWRHKPCGTATMLCYGLLTSLITITQSCSRQKQNFQTFVLNKTGRYNYTRYMGLKIYRTLDIHSTGTRERRLSRNKGGVGNKETLFCFRNAPPKSHRNIRPEKRVLIPQRLPRTPRSGANCQGRGFEQ